MDREITKQVFLNSPAVFGAIWFLVVGSMLLFAPRLLARLRGRELPTSMPPRGFGLAGILVIVIGVLTIVPWLFLTPGPSEKMRIMTRVLSASAEDIDSADVISWGRDMPGGVARIPIVVRDANRLKKLCDSLHTAVSWNLGHAPTVWECKLKLHHGGSVDTCLVEKIDIGKGVVVMRIFDRDDGGLTVGNVVGRFRCDDLGALIESWSRENNGDERKKREGNGDGSGAARISRGGEGRDGDGNLGIHSLAATAAGAEPAREAVARGNEFVDKGDFDAAITIFTETVRKNPGMPEVYRRRGGAYVRKSDFDKALDDFNEAIRLDPKYASAYVGRGGAYMAKREFDKALTDYDVAIRLDPRSAEAYVGRGFVFKRKDDSEKAIADYTDAIRINPKYGEAYVARGMVYTNMGDLEKAIADFTEAIRLNPRYPEAFWGRGIVYRDKGDSDKPIAAFRSEAHIYRSIAYVQKGAFDKGIADCTEAIRLNPKYPKTYVARGYAYGNKGDLNKAIADFTEAIPFDRNYVEPFVERGVAYARKGDHDKAIADYTEAIRLDPSLAPVYYRRGLSYGEKGDKAKAEQDFAQAHKLGYRKK